MKRIHLLIIVVVLIFLVVMSIWFLNTKNFVSRLNEKTLKNKELINQINASNNETTKIEIDNSSITSKGLKITIINKKHEKFSSGSEYKIQVKDTNGWDDLKPLKNAIFNALAYYSDDNGEMKQYLDFVKIYGELKSGTYRIIKDIYYEKNTLTLYSNEFIIQ